LKKSVFYLISQEYQQEIEKYIDVYKNYYSSMIKFDKDELRFSLEKFFHVNDVDEDIQE
jgi:hypothetical protein